MGLAASSEVRSRECGHSDAVRMPKQSLLSAELTRPQNTMLVLEMTRNHEMVRIWFVYH